MRLPLKLSEDASGKPHGRMRRSILDISLLVETLDGTHHDFD